MLRLSALREVVVVGEWRRGQATAKTGTLRWRGRYNLQKRVSVGAHKRDVATTVGWAGSRMPWE